jgi:hypothetical protein
MRSKTACVLLLLVGCDGTPPLDELPLRDSLRASPDVVAALPDDARARLAARLNAARTDPGADDQLASDQGSAAALVSDLDQTRERRAADALVVGTIDGTGRARALGELSSDDSPIVLDDGGRSATAGLEGRALAGTAGAALRALARASGARRLRRVIGWPIGAVAVGDTIYVNASWLVALAPETDGGTDAGAEAMAAASPTTTAPGRLIPVASPGDPPVVTRTSRPLYVSDPDGGTEPDDQVPVSDQVSNDACAAFLDSCGSGDSCSGGDDSGDSCSGGDDSGDSCGSTDDSGDSCDSSGDSGDSCGGSGSDGADACSSAPVDDSANCQVSRRRGRPEGYGTFACLLAPLAFLLVRGRR